MVNTITTPADLERSQQELSIKRNLKKIKRKIIVMSGKGGVGKSTVSSDAFLTQCLKWIYNYTTTGNWLVSIKFS